MAGATVDIRVLELLSARICHELISPVGAIANGVELLGEDDPDFVRDAVALIGQSSRKAGQRLQFYRFAYGYSSSGGGGPDGGELAAGLLEGGKVGCEWLPEIAAMPAEWQRLACNLVVLAAEALPRGGTIFVRRQASGIEVAGEGEPASLAPESQAALSASVTIGDLTTRTVQAYFCGVLAGQLGAKVTLLPAPGRVSFLAIPG